VGALINHEEASDYCEKCETGSFQLINHLIKEIQLLSSEVVRLRYSLSWFLPKHDGEMIRCEIVSDLHGSYYDYPAYQNFVSDYCDGDDPFESEVYCNHMAKLSNGEESDEFRRLTF
jgi:hypothetical protein